MRFVTWNCCRGAYPAKLEALRKLSPDVAVIQECARPDALLGTGRGVWFGENPHQGVAVVTANGFEVEAAPMQGGTSAFAARIHGLVDFNVLAIWAQQDPTYARAVLRELATHRSFLLERPCIVAGDFNTNGPVDEKKRKASHGDIVRMLEEDLGLVSAYHHFYREEHGAESRATHYWRWNEAKPWHIDFCFVPEAWATRIESVSVGTFADWADDSDHRPLAVDVGVG